MPSCGATFSIRVTLGYGVHQKTEEELNKACAHAASTFSGIATNFFAGATSANASTKHISQTKSTNLVSVKQDRFFVASASDVQLHMEPPEMLWKTNPDFMALFIPPYMFASCLEKHITSTHASGSSFWIKPPYSSKFAQDLLLRIHPSVVGCRIRGIVMTSVAANGPAEIIILEKPKGSSVYDILQATNGEALSGDKDCILKILPVTNVKFSGEDKKMGQGNGDIASHSRYVAPLLPTCPVCIHRIDPVRLGLPAPSNQHLCSRFCPSPIGSFNQQSLFSSDEYCPKQKLLNKWPLPARCKACQVIGDYWNFDGNCGRNDEDNELFCEECSMHKTLWTCLTCGFVGCGRYSNKHSVAHFERTHHPYALELATLRVWDYCHGEYGGFVQRADLLECPSSPPLSHPWLTRGLDMDNNSVSSHHSFRYNNQNGFAANTTNTASSMEAEKSSKKATMIGEEYEALLQSALEDQAQYFEGEITKLRADLTATMVDKDSMSPEETKEVGALRADIDKTRKEIEKASKALLEAQAQEARLRAESQKLLEEQQKSTELLKKIEEEHRRENEQGRLRIEDLEQQIADLSANLRMRQQFSENDELNNAQIFGTTSTPETRQTSGRRSKKKGRLFRK